MFVFLKQERVSALALPVFKIVLNIAAGEQRLLRSGVRKTKDAESQDASVIASNPVEGFATVRKTKRTGARGVDCEIERLKEPTALTATWQRARVSYR